MVRCRLSRRASALLGALIALGVPAVAAATQSSPLFAWSSTPKTFSEALAPVASELGATLSSLVSSAVGGGGSGDKAVPSPLLNHDVVSGSRPDVVLVVLGSQLKASDLRKHAGAQLLQPLQTLLDGAGSSLSLPHLMHRLDSAAQSLKHGVEEVAQQAGSAFQSIGCGSTRYEAAEVERAVADKPAGQPLVLLVCTPASDSSESDAAVAAELEFVAATHSAAASAAASGGKRLLGLYAVQPGAGAAGAVRRVLQAGGAGTGATGYTTCDALCQTQVQWLQGLLGAFVLIVAALAGMYCLYALDTPTRFESPKDTARSD